VSGRPKVSGARARTSVTRQASGLRIERTFSASPERVFAALSTAEELLRWWGPPACPVVWCTVDFRPGGVWHYCLRNASGVEVWARSVYREIMPPRLVSYDERSSNAAGDVTDERPGAFATIELASLPTGTHFRATLRYLDVEQRDLAIGHGVEGGFSEALDLLDRHLQAANPIDEE
jgi:uncharacterized protein YndB with AHSA1/START domain